MHAKLKQKLERFLSVLFKSLHLSFEFLFQSSVYIFENKMNPVILLSIICN